MEKSYPWWKERVVYQIYPRSFCDSNGDGIGDIPGIISKLDYLKNLGVGIIWLSPVYRSPNDDNGYDISDYKDIHPEFGTLDDMKQLISEAKKRDIKIIMDLVINHTSDEHEWFRQSRSSKDNKYRNYYYWKPARKNSLGKSIPPNNWTGFFGGGVWEKDDTTDEYYLHLFSKKQPDLNYNNPAVLEEIKSILRFWLDLGINGFRCDVINVIWKTSLADGKKSIALTGMEHYLSQEGCHKVLQELRRDVFNNYDMFTVGETVFVTPSMANDLRSPERKELDMVFGFEHMETDQIFVKWFRTTFSPRKFTKAISRWQYQVDWNANYIENHDQSRAVSRFGDDKRFPVESAKMLAIMLLSLRGTPFIYEGQELGMTNGDFKIMDDIRDVESHNIASLAHKFHFPRWFINRMIRLGTRDNARTPMQWSAENGGGFSPISSSVAGTVSTNASIASPWLKMNANYKTINVQTETADSSSVLEFYRMLIELRKNSPVLIRGNFLKIKEHGCLFVYKRQLEKEYTVTVLNFGRKPIKISNRTAKMIEKDSIMCSNYGRSSIPSKKSLLKPYEGFITKGCTI